MPTPRVRDRQDTPKPSLSNENLIINELFREYLEFNHYKHTLAVFMPETGQPVDRPFSRPFLAEQLNVTENETTRKIPLLYSILADMRTGAAAAGAVAGTDPFVPPSDYDTGSGDDAGVGEGGGAVGGGGDGFGATGGGGAASAAGGDMLRTSSDSFGAGAYGLRDSTQAALPGGGAAKPMTFTRL